MPPKPFWVDKTIVSWREYVTKGMNIGGLYKGNSDICWEWVELVGAQGPVWILGQMEHRVRRGIELMLLWIRLFTHLRLMPTQIDIGRRCSLSTRVARQLIFIVLGREVGFTQALPDYRSSSLPLCIAIEWNIDYICFPLTGKKVFRM